MGMVSRAIVDIMVVSPGTKDMARSQVQSVSVDRAALLELAL